MHKIYPVLLFEAADDGLWKSLGDPSPPRSGRTISLAAAHSFAQHLGLLCLFCPLRLAGRQGLDGCMSAH